MPKETFFVDRVEFTSIGAEYTEGKHDAWKECFKRIGWHTLPCSLPMSQGMGIQEFVKEFEMPPPIRAGWGDADPVDGPEFHPTTLAAEFCTSKQKFRVYLLDQGNCITPLAMEHISETTV